ncbi:MAG TPA: hypothetical protein VGD91_11350 [Trebonia sp.]
MRFQWLGITAAVLAALAVPATAASAAPERAAPSTLVVSGAVSDPASYTVAALAALPQENVTLPAPGGRTVQATGVSLDALVNSAAPVLPDVKNGLLRVVVTASGPGGHRVSFALGELDPSFGDHDAVVLLSVNGRHLRAPALAVPGDQTPARDRLVLSRVSVQVTSPVVTVPPASGALVIENGTHTAVLSAARLARLPRRTLTVTFLAGTTPETLTESGPTLAAVLRAAHVGTNLGTWVAAVGSDGYVADVTPAEAWPGGRPLLVSLAENGTALAAPRLVADGDVKGGRYVSGVDDLVVGRG